MIQYYGTYSVNCVVFVLDARFCVSTFVLNDTHFTNIYDYCLSTQLNALTLFFK